MCGVHFGSVQVQGCQANSRSQAMRLTDIYLFTQSHNGSYYFSHRFLHKSQSCVVIFGPFFTKSTHSCQTGKYAVCPEDPPCASKLPCVQRPIKHTKFENMLDKYATLNGEVTQGQFFQTCKFDGKNLFRALKTNFPVWHYCSLFFKKQVHILVY